MFLSPKNAEDKNKKYVLGGKSKISPLPPPYSIEDVNSTVHCLSGNSFGVLHDILLQEL